MDWQVEFLQKMSKLVVIFIFLIDASKSQYVRFPCCDDQEGDVRLNDGRGPHEGRVEVCLHGQWGTLKWHQGWNKDTDASVICRQLGFSGTYSYPSGEIDGYKGDTASGQVWMANVHCNGDEENITQCAYEEINEEMQYCYMSYNNYGCNVVRVTCLPEDGSILLQDDEYPPNDGRLRMYVNKIWYTIPCHQNSKSEADVVCRQLGFNVDDDNNPNIVKCIDNEYYTRWHTTVKCRGSETTFSECLVNSEEFVTNGLVVGLYCSSWPPAHVSGVLDEVAFPDIGLSVEANLGKDSASVNWTNPVAPDIYREYFNITSDHQLLEAFPIGDTLVTVKTMDPTGNCDARSFTVTVRDEEPPVLNGTFVDIPREIPCTRRNASIEWAVPSASDNSGNFTLVSNHQPGDNFDLGETAVVYNATDPSGNYDDESFIISVTVADNVYMNISLPTDPGISIGTLDVTEPKLDTHLTTYDITTDFLGGDTFPIGVTRFNRTGLGTGPCENVLFEYEITITDEELPIFHGSFDYIHKEVICAQTTVNINWTVPSVSDNSGNYTLTSNYDPGHGFDHGETTVVYTAIDPSGNSDDKSFVINITVKNPVVTNITLTTDPGKSEATLNWTEATLNWTEHRALKAHRQMYNLTENFPEDTKFPIGVTRRNRTGTGSCQNVTFVYNIYVIDDESPVFNRTLEDIHHQIPCTDTNAPVMWAVPSVSDNSGNFTLVSNHHPGDDFYLGETTVVYNATDPSGNSVEDSFNVSVTVQDPVVTNITLTTDPGNFEARLDKAADDELVDHLETYKLEGNFPEDTMYAIGVTSLNRTGSGSCQNVTFVYNIYVIEETVVKEYEKNVSSFAPQDGKEVTDFMMKWDDVGLLLADRAEDPLSVETESFVLKEFRFSEDNEVITLEDGVANVVVNLPPAVKRNSDGIVIGCLKSAHQSIDISGDSVQDSSDIMSYEFGSPICSFNLLGNNTQPVALANESCFEMKYDVLPEALSIAENENKTPVCYFFSEDGLWSQDGCFVSNITESDVTCCCEHLTSFAVLMQVVEIEIPQVHKDILHYLTIAGIVLSSASLFATLIFFGLYRLYKKIRVIIHINLVLSLLIGQLTFAFGIEANANDSCIAVTVMLHYLFLSLFMWMLMEGVFLFIKMKPTIRWSMKPAIFIPVAWSVPIPIVIITAATSYRYFGINGACWLPISRGIVFAFAAPAIVITTVNAAILIATIKTFRGLKSNKDKSQVERFRASVRALAILEPLLGLTWIFGVLQFDKHSAIVFGYLFVICNTFQGVCIFIWQCIMDEDILKDLKKRFCKNRVEDISSSRANLATAPDADDTLPGPSRETEKSTVGPTIEAVTEM